MAKQRKLPKTDVVTYDGDDKLTHLARMFNKRTKGKKYENFIVNAIYTKIDNLNLKPVTQYYVCAEQENGEEKPYYIDLYFPQIRFAIEVDEAYHEDDEQKQLDDKRGAAISKKMGVKTGFYRIRCSEHKRIHSPDEIRRQIDEAVKQIQTAIKQNGALKWKTDQELQKEVVASGRLDADYNKSFGGVNFEGAVRIHKLLGIKYGHAGAGADLKNGYSTWVGGVPIMTKDGTTKGSKNSWKNYWNEGSEELIEIVPSEACDPRTCKKKKDLPLAVMWQQLPIGITPADILLAKYPDAMPAEMTKRVTFLTKKGDASKDRGESGKEVCHFLGVLQLDRYEKDANGEVRKVSKRINKIITFDELLRDSPKRRG